MNTETQSEEAIDQLIQVVKTLVTEVHPHRAADTVITLDSVFEKDLGLDSLARVELIARVEKQFGLALPERSFIEAETVRDLLRALLGAVSPRTRLSVTEMHAMDRGASTAAPIEAQTLIDILDWHVLQNADRPHIQFYTDEDNGEIISYQQLKNGAMKVAAGLQQLGIQPAEPVAVMLPSDETYFYCFYGILMAGGIPVPMYPPARPSQLEDHMRRHVRILDNCLATTLITVDEARHVAHLLKSQVPALRHVVSVNELTKSDGIATTPVLNTNDIAFIQYTSGSTGNPKGVVLTHANLLANIRAMGQVVKANPDDVFVSWLPLYHDMGLIGAWLGSLYYAALFVVMPPLSFLARPERWLWAIHRYRGTLSASPNFGYEYCLRRLSDEELQGLDLSSWRCAFNGAEAVSPETVQNFSQRFAAYDFNEKAMMPVYGLAESSVGLAFPPLSRGVVIDSVERQQFMHTGQAVTAKVDDEMALKFVSSGLPLPGHQIRVVDAASHELPEKQEGRLQFRGPSTTSGYYRDAEKTQQLFDGDWLDSGDLGYIANGEVYVTGRIKDIIIRAGRNIYPHELEEAVGNIDKIRAGRVAVFGSQDKKTATERLIVLAETRSQDKLEREDLTTEINTLVTDLAGAPPDEVVLAPPGTVLKTSSGKIRRAASREVYEKDVIGKSKQSVSWQVLRLSLHSILPEIRRSIRYLISIIYAAYGWMGYMLLAPIVWLSAVFLPVFSWRWSIMSGCARLLAWMTGVTIKVNGVENLPADNRASVLVANHSSYLDTYVLVAKLPLHVRFIAKSELAKSFMTRVPLKHIHAEFVERFEISQGVKDMQRLSKLLKTEQTLFFFAEGTFTRVPGLKPFHLGAFSVAAEANVPVIPIAIRGTRSIMRAESWFLHRGSVHIEIGEPIDPQDVCEKDAEDTWQVAIALRDRSREFILRHCGEPDLAKE